MWVFWEQKNSDLICCSKTTTLKRLSLLENDHLRFCFKLLQIALARSKLTGRVDRSQTIYPGCYLMFPDTELIRFQATGHQLRVDAHISSSEGLAVRLQLALQYFIK